jgi:hypothetical protein
MEQAKAYLTRFQKAETLESRQEIVAEYKIFYMTLNEIEQQQADQVMLALRPVMRQRVTDLEQLIAKAQDQISGRMVQLI